MKEPVEDPRRADEEARDAAQQCFEGPLLVEAGAGTGKTSVLVHRIAVWSLGPGWERAEAALSEAAPDPEAVAGRVLDRVVAITFTEAAAAEMEARVGETLRALESADEPDSWPEGLARDALPRTAAVRRARAGALLAAFDRLRVSTIHAWCRRLLAEHPLEAGVHPRFTVDARGLARAATARETVEAWLREGGQGEDEALVDLVGAGVAAPELEEMLGALLAAAMPAVQFAEDPLAPARIGAFAARLRAAAGDLAEAEGGCLAGLGKGATGPRVAKAVRALCTHLAAPLPPGVAELDAQVRELRAQWPEALRARLRVWATGGFNESERRSAGERSDVIGAAARRLAPLLDHACRLEPAQLARVHRVLAPLLEKAEARMRREGAESFDALLRRTRALLDGHPGVVAGIRAGIDQLLVDEFQDTDATQCAIVERLALEGPPGARPELFVVGDPKQSIYGWRNADLAAYESFRGRVAAAGGSRHRLCVNHRSVPALLDEVATVMSRVMRAEDGLQPRFEPLVADAKLAGADAGGAAPAVEYWVSSDWDAAADAPAKTASRAATELEARHLAQDLLARAREGGATWRWQDVGLLLRGLADADRYLEALRRAGIPYVVARDRSYYRRREVLEAGALVRAALDPSDQIALVATLRSAWAGVPDAAWRPLWDGGLPERVRAALDGTTGARERLTALARAAAEQVRGLAIPGLDRLQGWEHGLLHALDVLVALRRSFETEPAERFVEKLRTLPLLDATEGARFLGAWRLANLDRFFRELGAMLEETRGDPAPVLRALRRDASRDPGEWDEGRALHPSEDAVQVMTIHGAKGLEFEHVYLLQLHKGAGTSDDEAFRAGVEALASEWRLEGKPAVCTLDFDAVTERRRAVAEHEQVRLLYVAMTRAKRRLVLAGSWHGTRTRGAFVARLSEARDAALADALARVRSAGGRQLDVGGLRWVFPARAEGAEERSERVEGARVDLAQARAASASLRQARRAAGAHAQRSFGAAPSEKRPEELREVETGRGAEAWGAAGPEEAVEIATAVGTEIHALLERFDWSAAPAREWERQRTRMRAALERRVAPARRERTLERAERILARLASGSLFARLRALAPRVVARELPMLARGAASPGEPVGYWAGAIDWLYLDPATGELVVADFKTDLVDAGELAERCSTYRAQGAVYARGVQEALALASAPRFELWFLYADRVEVLATDP